MSREDLLRILICILRVSCAVGLERGRPGGRASATRGRSRSAREAYRSETASARPLNRGHDGQLDECSAGACGVKFANQAIDGEQQ